jgi:hypothetical protein
MPNTLDKMRCRICEKAGRETLLNVSEIEMGRHYAIHAKRGELGEFLDINMAFEHIRTDDTGRRNMMFQ